MNYDKLPVDVIKQLQTYYRINKNVFFVEKDYVLPRACRTYWGKWDKVKSPMKVKQFQYEGFYNTYRCAGQYCLVYIPEYMRKVYPELNKSFPPR